MTAESKNPVYESADKDLKSDEQQALQSSHVYQEMENHQSPTSCTPEYSTPYENIYFTQ